MNIKIPALPVSVNKAFATDFRTRRRFKTKEYSAFQKIAWLACQGLKAGHLMRKPLNVSIVLNSNWMYKNGKPKRVDLANFEKTLVDSVFSYLGLDDSYIFQLSMLKIQSDVTMTEMKIIEMSQQT